MLKVKSECCFSSPAVSAKGLPQRFKCMYIKKLACPPKPRRRRKITFGFFYKIRANKKYGLKIAVFLCVLAILIQSSI